MSEAALCYNSTTAEQIESFQTHGFALVTRNDGVCTDDLSAMNTDILQQLYDRKDTWAYRYWRWQNSIATPTNRYSLPLPLTASMEQMLARVITPLRPLFDSQLDPDSPLVECNALISLPGALAQRVHSDVPWSESVTIISAFVALAPVLLDSGPTHVIAGTHTEAAHANDRAEQLATLSFTQLQTEEERDQSALERFNPAQFALLQPGDVLVFDARVYHYGGANTSASPRSMLSFSFQQAATDRDESFTYHATESLIRQQYALSDFCH